MQQLTMNETKLCTRFGEILQTTDYKLFNTLKGNRKVNEAHVLRLMESMNKVQLIVPIIVNEDMCIVDGQHRFEAIRRLGKTVYYIGIQGYGVNECHILNANSRNYKMEDFLRGYAELGYEEYKKFTEFQLQYPFLSMHLCQIYLSHGLRQDNRKHGENFKTGNFKVSNYEQACLWAERTYDFHEYVDFLTNRNFNTALLKMYMHPRYDHKKMMNKVSYQSAELRIQAKEKYFIEMLCNIYNSRSREDERIYTHEVQLRNTK